MKLIIPILFIAVLSSCKDSKESADIGKNSEKVIAESNTQKETPVPKDSNVQKADTSDNSTNAKIFEILDDKKFNIQLSKISNSLIVNRLEKHLAECKMIFGRYHNLSQLTSENSRSALITISPNAVVDFYFQSIDTIGISNTPSIRFLPNKGDCPEFENKNDEELVTVITQINNGEGKLSMQTIFPGLISHTTNVTPNNDGTDDVFDILYEGNPSPHGLSNSLQWLKVQPVGGGVNIDAPLPLSWTFTYGSPATTTQLPIGDYEFEEFYSDPNTPKAHPDGYLIGTFSVN